MPRPPVAAGTVVSNYSLPFRKTKSCVPCTIVRRVRFAIQSELHANVVDANVLTDGYE